ncbi:hypothetical protein AM588_10006858 [Phytophthora nicotianae]|uniref:LarA-like N-terminal domain-containing protein n=1 Tax=Phytophthora nicotianae TaxID=4792 RepID=A0A0W8DHD7_PHYNI|nr:hypothetical protein AM588_10006858 [Phytophthora nicotianae]
MALQLVDDDLVLEAALSLLEQPDDEGGGSIQQTPCKKKRNTRGYNPNRARESQYKELLDLRQQVPQLEKRLETLKREISSPKNGSDMMELWKKLALHERKSRESAEEENKRLRELVRENNEVTNRNVQQLLQARQEHLEGSTGHRPEPWPWPYRRMYAVPINPCDGSVFREMAESIDAVHRHVLRVYNPALNYTTPFSTRAEVHCRAIADKILPYDVDSVGDAAWQFFAHSFRRPTTRFYYHADSHEVRIPLFPSCTMSIKTPLRARKRNTRGYNPNRARESQYKELLDLRQQVPQLEKRLETLKREISSPKNGSDMMELWKKLALHERKSRESAEEENKRLRELVRENNEVTNRNVQQLLQARQEHLEGSTGHRPEPWPWPYRRMYAVPINPCDGSVFREMAESIDATTELSDERLREIVRETLQKLETQRGTKFEKAVIVPPDFTRFHSKSGVLSQYAYEYLQDKVTDVLPALGTHDAMTDEEISKMFGDIPKNLFRVHDWRNDVVTIGQVPAELIQKASDGKVNEPWPAQINRLLWEGGHDLVLSIGQVVPHEVMEWPISTRTFSESGNLVTRGVFIGDDEECFMKAAELSLEVNFELLAAPIDKVVVYLDPEEFKSTWLGNKSIYRTRMAIADDGELIVLAPGVARFGEDKRIDELIRKYGYRTTPEVLAHLNANRDLMKNLSAAAHLIHGSSEGRFRITYCPGHLTKEEVEGVGFGYGNLQEMSAKYPVDKLQDGWNVDADGERFFYISNPALGLWAYRGRFEGTPTDATSTSASATSTHLSAAADTTEACLDAGVGGGPFKHS